LGEIGTKEEAEEAVRQASGVFIAAAILEVIAGLYVGVHMIIKGGLFLLLALLLRKSKRRAIAIKLSLLTSVAAIVFVGEAIKNHRGWISVLISVIVALIGLRVVYATFVYNKKPD